MAVIIRSRVRQSNPPYHLNVEGKGCLVLCHTASKRSPVLSLNFIVGCYAHRVVRGRHGGPAGGNDTMTTTHSETAATAPGVRGKNAEPEPGPGEGTSPPGGWGKLLTGRRECRRCGGLVVKDGDEMVCLICARRSYPPTARSNRNRDLSPERGRRARLPRGFL